jgi:CBS domain-containing protein
MPVVLDRLRSLRVADIMSRRVVSVSASSSLDEAAERLVREEVSGVPVVDEMGRCVGILSALDFVRQQLPARPRPDDLSSARHVLARSQPSAPWIVEETGGARVADNMSPAVQCIAGSALLTEAARIMALSHVHRLPVLDDQSRPVGVVSALDIVSALVTAVDEAADIDRRAARRGFERQIKEEHAALHRQIRDARDVLAGRRASERPFEVLLRLCREAKQHFDYEEQGGYFAEALSRAPRLSGHA